MQTAFCINSRPLGRRQSTKQTDKLKVNSNVRVEVFMVVKIEVEVFWVM